MPIVQRQLLIRIHRHHRRRAYCWLALLLIVARAQADIAVVAGARSNAGELSKEQVTDIFLGKSTTFTAIDQADGGAIQEEFHSRIVGRTSAQIKAYWTKLVFTGKGVPPKKLNSSAEIKKAVEADPNAIGYIDKAAVDSTVKVLLSAP